MRITLIAESEEQAAVIGKQLNFLIENTQETGHCVALFPKMFDKVAVRAFIKKTKAGYSIKSWEENIQED